MTTATRREAPDAHPDSDGDADEQAQDDCLQRWRVRNDLEDPMYAEDVALKRLVFPSFILRV